jgi:NAD(P)-dependent dehydrogenase (short-subunit alcohol dehydrogenase family)
MHVLAFLGLVIVAPGLAAPAGTVSSVAAAAPDHQEARVAVVTGSTGGLGREVALALGADGWHVVVHGRNAQAGAEVVAAIEAGPGSAHFMSADLASMEAVRGRFGEAGARTVRPHRRVRRERRHLARPRRGVGR